MKNILLFGALAIVVMTVTLFVMDSQKNAATGVEKSEGTNVQVQNDSSITPAEPADSQAQEGSRLADPNPAIEAPSTVPLSKLKVANFTGKLEKVDTSCFADGECYVVVDGKHITAIMGWSRETVGQVLGVDGFGDLESHIGAKVEVYAQDTSDGKYTLYGNEGFYIKLIK
jgi:hypothetical protein